MFIFNLWFPEKVQAALLNLKANNPFYRDIEIHMDIIQPDLLSYDENEEIDLFAERIKCIKSYKIQL